MTSTQNITQNRESWLSALADAFRPRFTEIGLELPPIRISVGFGPTGARVESAKILGVTLNPVYSSDGVTEIWISPEDASTASMAATLIHEMIHAADFDAKHGARFAEAATRLGLTGPMTATYASADLLMELELIVASLGEYPGGFVDFGLVPSELPVGPDGQPITPPRQSSGPAKQGTRMLKFVCDTDECPAQGYSVRTTAKWAAIGAPKCPMGHDMH